MQKTMSLKAFVSIFLFVAISILPIQGTRAAPPLSLYGNLPGFESAAISMSGDHVALIGVAGDKRRLIVIGKAGKIMVSAELGAAKVRSIQWAGDDNVLLEFSATANLGIGFTADKAELFSMLVIPVDGKKPWTVFDKDSLITGGFRSFYGLREKSGKWYGYFSGITLERNLAGPYLLTTRPVLYEVDLQTQRIRKISDRGTDYRSWLVGPDGEVEVVIDYFSESGKWRIRNARHEEIASGVNKLGGIGLVGLGTDPGTFIYSDEDPESLDVRWYQFPLAGGEAKEILAGEDIGSSVFDHRSGRLIGYRLQGDLPGYRFFDPYHDKVAAATRKAFPNLSVHLIDWNDRFDRLIVQTEGVGEPVLWWLVDIKTGAADPLGASYAMAAKDVAPMKMIRYKAGDGTDIDAVLTLPPGRSAMHLPVIVLPHGGPTARDYPGFDWWAQAFASRGYAVLQPNFRGSSGYGVAFERAGHGEWGRKMQSDVSDGLAHLATQGIADPKRACIMGASYGGYVALAGVTLQQGLYRCAVSVAGISDVKRMVATDIRESGGNQTLRRALKKEVGSGRDLNGVSPIRFAASADAPILLIHGQDDTVVGYDQSKIMADALRRADKPVEFVTLPGEDHWLSKSETRRAMLEAAMAFVTKHNPPDAE